MTVLDLQLETSVSPERVFAAATDFSERRPDFWPMVSRKQYRVFSLGDHQADVEEGTAPLHHRAQYEWSDENRVVRATTIDASAARAGSIWEMRVSPRPGGGSIVNVHQDFRFKRTPYGIMVRLMSAADEVTFKRWLQKTLTLLEASEGSQ